MIDRFARLALDCVHREYPNHISHLLRNDDDVRPPRALTPAFYGCYDWHSAVHGHWVLAVAAREAESEAVRIACREALARSITPSNIAAEVAYLAARPTFERPYGLAWLATLYAELEPEFAAILAPLVEVAAAHLRRWWSKLSSPIRSGTHSQTAFAMGLLLEAWTRTGRTDDAAQIVERARTFHLRDRDLPIHLEPDGEDFLSPSLGVADLMSRILDPPRFAAWLDRAIPALGRDGSLLVPATVSDPTDGRLAHLDGLNLSRAWMLRTIARALPDRDPRIAVLERLADAHRERGLASVGSENYEGAHWLGTFATRLLRIEQRGR
jgi:hypothetical protein